MIEVSDDQPGDDSAARPTPATRSSSSSSPPSSSRSPPTSRATSSTSGRRGPSARPTRRSSSAATSSLPRPRPRRVSRRRRPVISRQPIEPGTSTISIDGSAQQGLPQGPQPPPRSAEGQLPPGAVPLGPDGAPTGAPPGPRRRRPALRPARRRRRRRRRRPATAPPTTAPDRAMSADAARAAAGAEAIAELDEVTRRLRRECPWDREQDERSIVPHTVEEAYELADAAAPATTRSCSTSSATSSSRSTSSRCCSRSAGRATWPRSPRTRREADPPPPACVRRGRGRPAPTRSAPNWDRIKREVGGPRRGGPVRRRPREPAGAALRPQAAAPRRRPACRRARRLAPERLEQPSRRANDASPTLTSWRSRRGREVPIGAPAARAGGPRSVVGALLRRGLSPIVAPPAGVRSGAGAAPAADRYRRGYPPSAGREAGP